MTDRIDNQNAPETAAQAEPTSVSGALSFLGLGLSRKGGSPFHRPAPGISAEGENTRRRLTMMRH